MKSRLRKASLGIAQSGESENGAIKDSIKERLRGFPFEDEQERHKVKKDLVTWIDYPHKISVQSFDDFHSFLKKKCGVEDDVLDKATFNPEAKCPCCWTYALVPSKKKLAMRCLIENQYKIKWNTDNKDPEALNFYKLCQKSKMFLTYDIRRAHVISRLWQKQEELRQINDLDYKQLCPPIYTRNEDGNGWRKWTRDESPFLDEPADIDWIEDDTIRRCIQQTSTARNVGGYRKLYCAVFKENEAQEYNDENRDENVSKRPSPIQVYVGRAGRGISARWLGGTRSSHCKQMEKARYILSSMLEYDPTLLQSFQLVDLRLLLHKACNPQGDNSGLFIIDYTGDNLQGAEQELIGDLNANNMNRGLNGT